MNTNSIPDIGVDILVNGSPLKIHTHEGRLFVEAKEGSEYEIRVKNDSGGRVLAVGSVDGLNVVNGQAATENGAGYVLSTNDSLRIKGFRYSDEKVGAFKFSAKKDSYASSKGESVNCGVIGVCVFKEKVVDNYTNNWPWSPSPWPHDYYDKYPWGTPVKPFWYGDFPQWTCVSSGPASATEGMVRDCSFNSSSVNSSVDTSNLVNAKNNGGFDLGTSWGDAKESKVTTTEFERGNKAGEVLIYYASRQALLDMGVSLTKESKVSFPQAFPVKFAEKPVGWSG